MRTGTFANHQRFLRKHASTHAHARARTHTHTSIHTHFTRVPHYDVLAKGRLRVYGGVRFCRKNQRALKAYVWHVERNWPGVASLLHRHCRMGRGWRGGEGWGRSQGKSSGSGGDAATAGGLLAVLRCLYYSLTIINFFINPLQTMF